MSGTGRTPLAGGVCLPVPGAFSRRVESGRRGLFPCGIDFVHLKGREKGGSDPKRG
jgi:hypothetical protein